MIRNAFFILPLLFIAVWCIGCNTVGTTEKLPEYSVISDDEFGIGKNSREVAILLQEPVSENELTVIANKIRDSKRKSYERTNTHFFLPGMKPGEGAWATANFNPDLEVSIFGATREFLDRVKSEEEQARKEGENFEIIGRWDPLRRGSIITIKRKDEEYLIGMRFQDGSGRDVPTTIHTVGNDIVYDATVAPLGGNDVTSVRISPSGNLVLMGDEGDILTYPKIE